MSKAVYNEAYKDALKTIHGGLGAAINDFGDGNTVAEFSKSGAAARRALFAGGGGEKGGAYERPGLKVHHGAHGEVYELKAGTKLSDALPQKDTPEIPLDRWLGAAMLGDRCEDKVALEFAKEAKSLSTASSGTLIPEAFQSQWADNLRSFMVLEAAGMTTATMQSASVTSSMITSDPNVGWRGEGQLVPASDPTFQLQTLVARSLAVRVQSSVELAQDSPDFGTQLLSVMGKALAVEVDRAGLIGNGGFQPRGIVNTPGINTVPLNGAFATYTPFITGLQRLLEANVPLERCDKNAIMSPRTWGHLEGLYATDGQPLMRPRALENMVSRPTTSIPNDLGVGDDESVAIMGDFSELVMGVRMEATVEALRLQTYATNLQLEFIGWTRVDFLVRRPASFVILQGIEAEA